MDGGQAIRIGAVLLIVETELIREVIELRTLDPLPIPGDLRVRAGPTYIFERRESTFDESSIESRVMGHYQRGRSHQVLNLAIVNPLTVDIGIRDACERRDFWWDRNPGVLKLVEPLQHSKDPTV